MLPGGAAQSQEKQQHKIARSYLILGCKVCSSAKHHPFQGERLAQLLECADFPARVCQLPILTWKLCEGSVRHKIYSSTFVLLQLVLSGRGATRSSFRGGQYEVIVFIEPWYKFFAIVTDKVLFVSFAKIRNFQF